VYLIDIACFSIAVLKKYRDTLPINKRKVKMLEVKVSGLLPGTRSYECKVVGTGDTVRLTSKSLTPVYASGSRTETPEQSQDTSDDSSGADGVDESASSAEDAAEADVVDATPAGFSLVGAADWRPVLDFDDLVTQRHPGLDVHDPDRMRSSVAKTPCDLFLALLPMKMVEPRLVFGKNARKRSHGVFATELLIPSGSSTSQPGCLCVTRSSKSSTGRQSARRRGVFSIRFGCVLCTGLGLLNPARPRS
jgi:hypothetical protein